MWLVRGTLAQRDLENHYLMVEALPVASAAAGSSSGAAKRGRRRPTGENQEPAAQRARTTVQQVGNADADRLHSALEPALGEDFGRRG